MWWLMVVYGVGFLVGVVVGYLVWRVFGFWGVVLREVVEEVRELRRVVGEFRDLVVGGGGDGGDFERWSDEGRREREVAEGVVKELGELFRGGFGKV